MNLIPQTLAIIQRFVIIIFFFPFPQFLIGSIAVAMNPKAVTANTSVHSAMQPYSENPFYWEFRGKPIILIGGSDLDSLFQWDESVQPWLGETLTDHLDTLQSVGGNYVRNAMNSRSYEADDEQMPLRYDRLPYAFAKLENGKFDLDQWDPAFWDKLTTLLDETQARGIIVQIEIWDRYIEFADSNNNQDGWYYSPWNPNNNVNYNWEDSPLLIEGYLGWKRYNPFHMAANTDDPVLLPYQQTYVQKIIDTVVDGGYDNVLFQIDNESGIGENNSIEPDPYWAQFVRDYAASKGYEAHVTISRRFHDATLYLTTNFQDWNNPEIKDVILDPAVNYFDISQNNGNSGQIQYENLLWYRERLIEKGKIGPINNLKAYYFNWPTGVDWFERTDGDDKSAGAKAWRAIFGGAASFRFHRNSPTLGTIRQNGLGLNDLAQSHIRSIRMLTDNINIFTMIPANDLLSQRSEDEAYCLAETGNQIAVFFSDYNDHSVGVDLSSMDGLLELRWLDVENSQWSTISIISGEQTTLTAPGSGFWVAVIKPKSALSLIPAGEGTGRVQINDSIFTLPLDHIVKTGTSLTIQTVPDKGNCFSHWSGDIDSMINPIEIVVDKHIVSQVHFCTDKDEDGLSDDSENTIELKKENNEGGCFLSIVNKTVYKFWNR